MKPGFLFVAFIEHPKGRGRISLRSDSIYDQPVIELNFFSHPDDMKLVLHAIKLGLKIGNSPAFKKYVAKF